MKSFEKCSNEPSTSSGIGNGNERKDSVTTTSLFEWSEDDPKMIHKEKNITKMMKKTNRPVLKSSGSETALDVLLIAPERISSCQMFWEDYDSEFVQLKIDKTKTSDQNTENLNKPGISQNLASDSKTSPNVSRPVSVTETVSELVLEESPQVEDSKIESETKEIQKNDEAETAQIIWNEFGNVWEKIEAKFEQLPSVSGHDQQNANQGVLECPNDVNKEEGGSTNDHAQLSEKEEATTDSTPELESKDQNTGNEADIAGSSGEQLISPIPEDVDQDLPNSAESLGYNPLLMQFNKNDLPLGRNSDEDGSLTKEVLEFVEYLKVKIEERQLEETVASSETIPSTSSVNDEPETSPMIETEPVEDVVGSESPEENHVEVFETKNEHSLLPPVLNEQIPLPDELRRPSTTSTISIEKQSVTVDLYSELSEVNSLYEESPPPLSIPDDLPCSSSSFSSPMIISPISLDSIRSASPPANSAPPIPPPPVKTRRRPPPPTEQPSESVLQGNLPRLLQQLSISPLQFKAFPGLLLAPDNRISIQIKVDDDEVLETIAVTGSHSSRIYSETAVVELSKQNQHIKLVFIEHLPNSETRQIGRLTIKKRDIIPINGTEVVLPVQSTANSRSLVSAILGEILLNIEPKSDNPSIIQMKVLDYTSTSPLPTRRSSNSSISSTSSTTSCGQHLSTCNGKAFLAICVTAYGEPLGPMSKVQLVDRRAVQNIDFDCKVYKETCANIRARHTSDNSASSSTKDGNGNLKPNSETSPVRLNIKIYSDPSYDESSYVGFVRIPLDAETLMPIEKSVGSNWYEIKSRMTISNTSVVQQPTSSSPNTVSQYDSLDNMPSTSTTVTTTTVTTNTNITHPPNMPIEKVGDLRIKFWYSVEHILSLNHYQPLHDALLSALHAKPYDASLASLLQHLPIELGSIARPLMKIFLQNGLFEEFFRLVCVQYLSDGRESATLFRNQSMASKLMHEVMKYLGNDYLVSTLKPVIDLVYAEKKRTEIDPSKLNPGEKLDENTRNLAVYAELAIVRVVESADECPKALKNIFAVLRNAVNEFYPKVEIGRLAVSSFIIMRFFSAAILNPTQYGLKKRAPDPEVSRTLVLISKILQRLANCAVASHALTTKEAWLQKLMEKFFNDSEHRNSLLEFFDSVSIPGYQPSTIQNHEKKPEILKSGTMVEKRGRSSRRLSFKDFISQKRRFVTLTEKELSWQKIKEKDNSGEIEQKGVIPLSEITSVTQIQDSKTSFRVSTPQQEVNFQANNNGDMTEWMILLITRQRRHLFFHNRSNSVSKHNRQIDVEKELENLHTILMKHIEKIAEWKDQIEADETDPDPSNADKFPHNILQNAKTPESRKQLKEALSSTLLTTLSAIQSIENVHQKALALAIQMQNLQNYKSDKLGIKGLTDNENYLLMHGRDRHLKSKDIQPISKHLA